MLTRGGRRPDPGGQIEPPRTDPTSSVKASVFIGISLDGFIAREDGAIDWLHEVGDEPGEDYGYGAFFESVDALVMGRNTYELVRTFADWPYDTKPVIVLTSRPLEIPDALADRVRRCPARPRRSYGS